MQIKERLDDIFHVQIFFVTFQKSLFQVEFL